MENFKRSPKVSFRAAEDELVLLHIETGNYYTLNETGRHIWEYCSEPRNLAEIVEYMTSVYNIPADQVQRDIVSYVQFLYKENLFEKNH